VELAQLDLQVDVAAEQLGLGALAERGAQGPASRVRVLLPDLELEPILLISFGRNL
jgi:hypothetical protein